MCSSDLLYDAHGTTLEERRAITGKVAEIMEAARGTEGLAVDFSGTHSQPDDPGRTVSPPVIFGSAAMAERVAALKRRVDPGNRFRFHPFAKFL